MPCLLSKWPTFTRTQACLVNQHLTLAQKLRGLRAYYCCTHDAGAKSAQQLYEKELAARKIITFCGDLDNVLGGGIATGQITEFCKFNMLSAAKC